MFDTIKRFCNWGYVFDLMRYIGIVVAIIQAFRGHYDMSNNILLIWLLLTLMRFEYDE
jgi:hypothetical protein